MVLDGLVHVRARLESEMAGRAAELMTDSNLEELGMFLDTLAPLLRSPGEYQMNDAIFHDLILRASNSPLSRSVVRSLHSKGVGNPVYRGDRLLVDLVKYSHADHAAIVESLRGRDPDAAAEAMYDHIIGSWARRSGQKQQVARARVTKV